MTVRPVGIDLTAGFKPEIMEIKVSPALKKGLKRTFYRLDPAFVHLDQTLHILVNGLVCLDGILFNIQKVYRESWVKMQADVLIKEESIVCEVAHDKGLNSIKQASQLLSEVLGANSAFIHTDEDLHREAQTIKMGMMPFFENLKKNGNLDLSQRMQERFFASVESIYDAFHKQKISKRSEIFRSLKSQLIGSYYQTTQLMQPQNAEILALEYGHKIGEKRVGWDHFHHSLGLALFSLQEPITATVLAMLTGPIDLYKFLSVQMSYQITAEPRNHDLVVTLDEKNTPLYAGHILDSERKIVRYFVTQIIDEAKEPLFLQGGDRLQSSFERGNSISMGGHYALIINLPIDKVCLPHVAKMVFFQKR